MTTKTETTDSLTQSLPDTKRAGGPDNTRSAADKSNITSDTVRAGGPDNTRQYDKQQSSSETTQLPNTPRGGPDTTRGA